MVFRERVGKIQLCRGEVHVLGSLPRWIVHEVIWSGRLYLRRGLLAGFDVYLARYGNSMEQTSRFLAICSG